MSKRTRSRSPSAVTSYGYACSGRRTSDDPERAGAASAPAAARSSASPGSLLQPTAATQIAAPIRIERTVRISFGFLCGRLHDPVEIGGQPAVHSDRDDLREFVAGELADRGLDGGVALRRRLDHEQALLLRHDAALPTVGRSDAVDRVHAGREPALYQRGRDPLPV